MESVWKNAADLAKGEGSCNLDVEGSRSLLQNLGKALVFTALSQHEMVGSELLSQIWGLGVSPYIERVVRSLAPISASCNLATIEIVQGSVETTLKKCVERK